MHLLCLWASRKASEIFHLLTIHPPFVDDSALRPLFLVLCSRLLHDARTPEVQEKEIQVSDVVSFIEETARKAGARAVELFGRVEAEPKGRSIVSRADREVERIIIGEIRAAYPDDPILAEESGASGAGDIGLDTRWWAIDPIDGTGPYLKGLPFWAVSVACLRGTRVVAGVVHMPAMGQIFTAEASGPAMRNGAPLAQVSQGVPGDHDYLFVPCGEVAGLSHQYPGRFLALASAACHICLTAAGSAFGTLMEPIRAYDFAAAALVYERAGGSVGYLSGAEIDYAALADGRRAPEPVIAAPAGQIDWLRERVFWEQ